jgi:AraC-like DNA-binding protein
MQNRRSIDGLSCRIGHSRHPEAALHHHDRIEIGWCFEGHGTLLVDGRVERFAAPCAAVVAAGCSHFHHAVPGTQSRWTFVFVDAAKLLAPGATILAAAAARPAARAVLTSREHPGVCGPARLLAEAWEAQALDPDWLGGQVQSLLAAWRKLPGLTARAAGTQAGRTALEPAMRLLAAEGGAVRVADLARACGLAASSLREAFVRAHGVPPKRFLDRYRLDMVAAALLASPERKILSVALDCGFASQSAFNRAFQKEYRRSPRAWRKGMVNGKVAAIRGKDS